MKTPREILLARHRAAEAKLDAIRREAVAALPMKETERRKTAARLRWVIIHELLRPLRWHFLGLGAAWALIVLARISGSIVPADSLATRQEPPSPQQMAVVLENRRQLWELLGPPAPPPSSPARPEKPPRRSQLSLGNAQA